MRTLNRCLNRWYEHSKLVQIHELYKRDMLANQDEFVYVTWQDRERIKQAMVYLKRSRKHSETIKRASRYEKQLMNSQRTEEDRLIGTNLPDEIHSAAGHSQFSFDPQKLAQPTTISFARIEKTIKTLQQQFRKSHSERGSYLLDDAQEPNSR